MKLSQLLKSFRAQGGSVVHEKTHACDATIGSIHYRADCVTPGGLFVAVTGAVADGHDYIDQAIERGASAVVVEKKTGHTHTCIIQVDNSRKALALLASEFYGNPSRKMTMIGITGTNGKTTVSYLLETMLLRAGYQPGVIGTVNYRYGGRVFTSRMTTPESLDLQRILADMLADGVTHVIMEVSSHGLDLFRIAGCVFDVGVFTNLTQDHLDYHTNMDDYWKCKKRLFSDYLSDGTVKKPAIAVINCDDEKGRELYDWTAAKKISTGVSAACAVHVTDVVLDISGISGKLHLTEGTVRFTSPLVGAFNVENILSASGVAGVLGVSISDIIAALESFSGVPGRLERVGPATSRFVFVDYAHTPDALENVLTTLRALTTGRLIVIFGCGGDRDTSKRMLMGEIGAKISDICIVTSDNPRTENPRKIIDNILTGVQKVAVKKYSVQHIMSGFTEKGFTIEPDRRAAIHLGIKCSQPGDTVLIAGKGHETYQVLGTTKIDFDDRIEANSVLMTLESDSAHTSRTMI